MSRLLRLLWWGAVVVAAVWMVALFTRDDAEAQEATTTIPADAPAVHGDLDGLRVEVGAGLAYVVFGVGLLCGVKVVR